MEQLTMAAGREGERVVQILTDLMKNNRECKIRNISRKSEIFRDK